MNARYEGKPVRLVAKVKTKPDGAKGFITRSGLLRLKRGSSNVDVYFKDREARGITFLSSRIFFSTFLTYDGSLTDTDTESPLKKIIEPYQNLEKKAIEVAKQWCVDQDYEVKRIEFRGFDLKENTFTFVRLFGGMTLQSQIHAIPMDYLEPATV